MPLHQVIRKIDSIPGTAFTIELKRNVAACINPNLIGVLRDEDDVGQAIQIDVANGDFVPVPTTGQINTWRKPRCVERVVLPRLR